MTFRPLSGEQTRRLIDSEQRFEAYLGFIGRLDASFRGSMSWKSVKGHEYLYRKTDGSWKSLGPRNQANEQTFDQFHAGRTTLKQKIEAIRREIDGAARVDRAMGLGRLPKAIANILRRLDRKHLLGNAISVVGTNALFAYERLAGGHFAPSMLATMDIDLLFDSRDRLGLVARDVRDGGLAQLLQSVDPSFTISHEGSFRAINRSGLMVDLIEPMPNMPSATRSRRQIGASKVDLVAAEIKGLQWLQNVPHVSVIVLDESGIPLRMSVPDPRAFALHKYWVSRRSDRDPMKARRDEQQAHAVAGLIIDYLPTFDFADEHQLSAFPKALRDTAAQLLADHQPPAATDWE